MDVSFVCAMFSQLLLHIDLHFHGFCCSPYSPFSFVLTELEERNQDQDVIKLVTRQDYDIKMDEKASGKMAAEEAVALDEEIELSEDAPRTRKGRGGVGGKEGDEDEDDMSVEEEFARHMALQRKKKTKNPRDKSGTGELIDQAISEGDAMISAWWRQAISVFLYLIFMTAYVMNLQMRTLSRQAFDVQSTLHEALVTRPFFYEENHLDFRDIANTAEVWAWFEQSFIPTVYPEDHQDAPYAINQCNRLVGAIRMVQWRVKSDAKTSSLGDKIGQKYLPDFSTTFQDTSYFFRDGLSQSACASTSGSTKDAQTGCVPGFYFVSQTALENAQSRGRVRTNYPSSAYIVDVPLDHFDYSSTRQSFMNTVSKLQANNWIDRQTRAVQIKLSLYNPNLQMYTAAQLMIEWTAGGYVFTSYGLRPFDIGELDMEYFKGNLGTEENVLKVTCECIIHLYTVASVCIMVWKLMRQPFQYVGNIWNVMTMLSNFGLAGSTTLRVMFILDENRASFRDGPRITDFSGYKELQDLSFFYGLIFDLECANVFMIFMRVFKLFEDNESISQIWNTLGVVSGSLIAWLITFVLVLAGFCFMCLNVYGPWNLDFRQFDASFSVLMRLILGDFDYMGMESTHPQFTAAFFVVFVFVMLFVLFNILIGVICDGYAAVRYRIETREALQGMTDWEAAKHKYKQYKQMQLLKRIQIARKQLRIDRAFAVMQEEQRVKKEAEETKRLQEEAKNNPVDPLVALASREDKLTLEEQHLQEYMEWERRNTENMI